MKKIIVLLLVLGLLGGLWYRGGGSWGSMTWLPAKTVTVMGEAKGQTQNQIATFSAGVNVIKENKDEATKELNQRMDQLVEIVKKFGIKSEDIKTTSMSLYQNQDPYWDNGIQKYRPGNWNASSNIEITLREINRATELMSQLTSTGANNVYGPNFQADNTLEFEKGLMEEAVKNATDKATNLARVSGRQLGKIVSINELGANNSGVMYAADMGGRGGGGPMEPGSQTVSKSLTVVFELK
jgi:uncharacterized protein YggE